MQSLRMLTQHNGVINKLTHTHRQIKFQITKQRDSRREEGVEIEEEEKIWTLPLHLPFC